MLECRTNNFTVNVFEKMLFPLKLTLCVARHPSECCPRLSRSFCTGRQLSRPKNCCKKGNPILVLFVFDSFANRNHWNFPFLRQVHFYSLIQTKGQKARPHISAKQSKIVENSRNSWKVVVRFFEKQKRAKHLQIVRHSPK